MLSCGISSANVSASPRRQGRVSFQLSLMMRQHRPAGRKRKRDFAAAFRVYACYHFTLVSGEFRPLHLRPLASCLKSGAIKIAYWGFFVNMVSATNRPLSPHLGIYRRGVHMMASITHRATGFILATAGMLTLVWWLASIAGGEESYATFQAWTIAAGEDATGWQVASNWFFRLLALGVVFSFFQHMFSGIRHLVMDMGAGFELNANRTSAWLVFIGAFAATGITVLLVLYSYLGL